MGARSACRGARLSRDCDLPAGKEVGINDFLALLAQWGMIGSSCDLDGAGVGINDFLLLLANWGPCPPPPNDECLDKITIDRLDSPGTIEEQFDMWGATPSADASQCIALPAKDIWYCLRNSSMESKNVTLSGTVDLLAEVTAGCDCANPGPLLVCERLVAAEPTTFTMQPGDEVCIRLHNDLNLPNDIISGDLIITNKPAPPTSEKCYDQQPDQAVGFFSDVDRDACPGSQVLAEQLILVTPEMIDQLRFWGGYFPGDAGGGDPLPDNFTVKFRLNDDSTGIDLPGSVVRKIQIGPATTRTATGVSIFGVREFEYTIDLVPNQDLQTGFYWVEIYNDTSNNPAIDDWIWESGTLDAVNGLPDFAFSFDPPNILPKAWATNPGDLSLNMTCKPPVCDDCSDGSVDECNSDPTCHDCVTPAGDCLCAQGIISCIFADPCPAETCPPGFFCCTNVCCGLPVCLPMCGSPLAADPPPFVSPDEIFSGGAAHQIESTLHNRGVGMTTRNSGTAP